MKYKFITYFICELLNITWKIIHTITDLKINNATKHKHERMPQSINSLKIILFLYIEK